MKKGPEKKRSPRRGGQRTGASKRGNYWEGGIYLKTLVEMLPELYEEVRKN